MCGLLVGNFFECRIWLVYRMALLPMPAGSGVTKQIGPYSRGGPLGPHHEDLQPPTEGCAVGQLPRRGNRSRAAFVMS